MDKVKIGILTCSNTTRVLDCPVSACLKDMYERNGLFAQYKNNEIELIGISSCNGCPTILGESVILPKIESLVHYGATNIHISYCLLKICPFKNKYIKAIKENFPTLKIILGSHEPHQSDEAFKCGIAAMLKDRRKGIIP